MAPQTSGRSKPTAQNGASLALPIARCSGLFVQRQVREHDLSLRPHRRAAPLPPGTSSNAVREQVRRNDEALGGQLVGNAGFRMRIAVEGVNGLPRHLTQSLSHLAHPFPFAGDRRHIERNDVPAGSFTKSAAPSRTTTNSRDNKTKHRTLTIRPNRRLDAVRNKASSFHRCKTNPPATTGRPKPKPSARRRRFRTAMRSCANAARNASAIASRTTSTRTHLGSSPAQPLRVHGVWESPKGSVDLDIGSPDV